MDEELNGGTSSINLLYISAWNVGRPRGGIFSAITLLQYAAGIKSTLLVGKSVVEPCARLGFSDVYHTGYRDSPIKKSRSKRILECIRDVQLIKKIVREKNINIIVCDYEVCIPVAILKTICPVTIAFYLRGTPDLSRKLKITMIAKCFDAAFFLSQQLRESFLEQTLFQLRQTRTAIIANSLQPYWFDKKSNDIYCDNAPLKIAIIGAISSYKNQLWFLENVVPALVKSRLSFEVYLYGESVDCGYLDKINESISNLKIGERIKIIGYVENPIEMYNKFHVLVQVSIREGIARAVLEAAANKIPTVALRIDGIEAYINDAKTGFIVESAKDMADRIKKLNNFELRRVLGEGAYERVVNKHHPVNVANEFQSQVSQLLKGKIDNKCTV